MLLHPVFSYVYASLNLSHFSLLLLSSFSLFHVFSIFYIFIYFVCASFYFFFFFFFQAEDGIRDFDCDWSSDVCSSDLNAAIGAKGGVDTLEVFAPRGQGRVIIGHFLGTGGFQALLLPPHAKVRLRLFPISFWGDPPDRLRIEVVIAKTFSIGGESAEKWFGSQPMSSVKADITENARSISRMFRSKHTPDNKEVATRIEEDRRFHLLVPLKQKN